MRPSSMRWVIAGLVSTASVPAAHAQEAPAVAVVIEGAGGRTEEVEVAARAALQERGVRAIETGTVRAALEFQGGASAELDDAAAERLRVALGVVAVQVISVRAPNRSTPLLAVRAVGAGGVQRSFAESTRAGLGVDVRRLVLETIGTVLAAATAPLAQPTPAPPPSPPAPAPLMPAPAPPPSGPAAPMAPSPASAAPTPPAEPAAPTPLLAESTPAPGPAEPAPSPAPVDTPGAIALEGESEAAPTEGVPSESASPRWIVGITYGTDHYGLGAILRREIGLGPMGTIGHLSLALEGGLAIAITEIAGLDVVAYQLPIALGAALRIPAGRLEVSPRSALVGRFAYATLSQESSSGWSLDLLIAVAGGIAVTVPVGQTTKMVLSFDVHGGDGYTSLVFGGGLVL